MNVTIDEMTSALLYFGSTRFCETSVKTVHANIEISPNENTL